MRLSLAFPPVGTPTRRHFSDLELRQKAGWTLQARDKPNLNFSATFGKTKERLTVLGPGPSQDPEKAYKLKTSATRGRKKRGAGVLTGQP